MPRPPREFEPNGMYHVWARGNDRRAIYLDDADRRAYLAELGRVVLKRAWRCLSFCLMDNHLHLLIETPEPDLGAGMQRLQSRYAQAFNARHGRSGHVFQGRYGAVRIKDDQQLHTVVRYLAVNPVEAGCCDSAEHWPWSSYPAVLRRDWPAWLAGERLLTLLGAQGGDAARRYSELVTGA